MRMNREPHIESRRVLFHLFTTVLWGLMILSGTVNAAVSKGMWGATPEAIQKGRAIYEDSCIFCHGVEGRGDGPTAFFGASYFSPRPNDFTVGQYKFRSTPSGQQPTDQDLFRTITNGIPGYMPSFVGLSPEERWQVVLYLKSLAESVAKGPVMTIPIGYSPFPPTPGSISKGRQVYFQYECESCHGNNSLGDVLDFSVVDLEDSFGLPIRPTDLDFTKLSSLKNGSSARDIYRTLMTGLNGSPMPSFQDAFTGHEEDAWHLVNYIMSLSPRQP